MKKIYLFAAIFALIAGFGTYFFINSLQHNSAVTGVEEADVVIAVQDIEKDTPVTKEMFRVVKLPVTAITGGTASSINDIVGYVATEKLYMGEQVMTAKLRRLGSDSGDRIESSYRLSYDLEPGYYAYTIPVTETTAVGFFIKSGDYVNIYNYENKHLEEILKNAEVIFVSNYSDNRLQNDGTEISTYTVLTLKLTAEQIKTLEEKGDELRIALVSYEEGAGIEEEIDAIPIPPEQPAEPETNRGMGPVQPETTLPESEA